VEINAEEASMTDVEAVVQRYYGDRPVMQRIDDALRAAGAGHHIAKARFRPKADLTRRRGPSGESRD